MTKKKAIDMSVSELAKYIDYSVLKPEFTEEEIVDLTKDGVKLGCATICINPAYMDLCYPYVKDSETKLCPVVDFPFGTSSTRSKVEQVKILTEYDHVGEIDMVLNYGWVKSGKYDEVTKDVKAVADVCHASNIPIKVIFETDALTFEEIEKTIECCIEAGADFIKTATGFYTGTCLHGDKRGGFREMISFMIEKADGRCKVKASGAIRDRQHFLDLIDMGVDRMGIGYRSVPVVLDL